MILLLQVFTFIRDQSFYQMGVSEEQVFDLTVAATLGTGLASLEVVWNVLAQAKR